MLKYCWPKLLVIQDRSGPIVPPCLDRPHLSTSTKKRFIRNAFQPCQIYVAWTLLTANLIRMRAKCYTPGCQAGGFNTDTASGWSSVGLQLAFYLFSWSRTRHGFIVPTPSNYPTPCVYRALFSVKFMDIFSFLLFFSQTFICFNKLTIIDQKMILSLKEIQF